MHKQFRMFILFILAGLMMVPGAESAERMVDLSLITPIQLYPREDDLRGVRLNLLYGEKHNVMGLDLGLINITHGDWQGLGLGANIVDGDSKGVQLGLINSTAGDSAGFQVSLANMTKGDVEGFQGGLYNEAASITGIQFGLLNTTDFLDGLQIGLLNFHNNSLDRPFLPLVNWTF
jgi:hypothetical protein